MAAECNCLRGEPCPLKMVSHGEVCAIAGMDSGIWFKSRKWKRQKRKTKDAIFPVRLFLFKSSFCMTLLQLGVHSFLIHFL